MNDALFVCLHEPVMADCLAPGLTKTCRSNWPLLCARTQLDDEALVVDVDEDARTVNATVGER